jgi:hypothetical protein
MNSSRIRSARARAIRALSFVISALLLSAVPLSAHDMFWRLTAFFVAPKSPIIMPVLNGTFSRSENSIEWARVADLSVVSPSGRAAMDSGRWSSAGDTSRLSYTTGESGTYVASLSTKAKEFQLDAKAFNDYLKDDGIPDILALRTRDGSLAKPARERYSKHIKALFQVGTTRTDAWRTPLGYPAELVPLANPYALKAGATLAVRCLVDGKPAPKQLVMIGGRSGSTGDARLPARTVRSDSLGVVSVALPKAGRWYVKFINMTPVADGRVDYESKWATLTFEVR